jgi:hypothetical protein
MANVLDTPSLIEKVDLRFDYKRLGNGTVDSGIVYKLAKDWLVDYSPSGELGFALLRLEQPAGAQTIKGVMRGWLKPPSIPHDFISGDDLYIVQFPRLEAGSETESLKIVLATKAIQGLGPKSDRVIYRAATAGGAGGAPCFSSNWELVAMHRGQSPQGKGVFKDGIPLAAICAQPKVKAALGL